MKVLISFVVMIIMLVGCVSPELESQSISVSVPTGNSSEFSDISITQDSTDEIKVNRYTCCERELLVYPLWQFNEEEYSKWWKPEYTVVKIVAPHGICQGMHNCPATIIYYIK